MRKELTESKLSPSCFIGVQGKDIISFGSGQPDLPPPEQVYKCLPDYEDFKYGTIQGDKRLREKLSKAYPASTPNNFVITNGASEALDLILRTIKNIDNDQENKILMLKPYYYSYPHLVKFSGMQAVYCNSLKGRFDMDDFREKIKDCKAVIINSPSNPTGRVESIQNLKEIEKITQRLGVYVISDEVYKDLIYKRENYLIKGPHVITINSFSKTYAMCGFRVGYLWSLDKSLVDEVINMKTHTSMNTNILGQEMALEALNTPKEFLDSQLLIWKERRDLICNRLKNMGLDIWEPEGAFYVLPKIDNPKQFVLDMYNKHGVITYLGEWFGEPNRVRFSYALDKEKIEKGMNLVEKYLKERN